MSWQPKFYVFHIMRKEVKWRETAVNNKIFICTQKSVDTPGKKNFFHSFRNVLYMHNNLPSISVFIVDKK